MVSKKCAGIEGGGVADVAALGVGDDELIGVIGPDMGYYFLKGCDARGTEALEKCQVGFVGYAIGCGGVDDCLAEACHALAVATADARGEVS